MNRKIFLIGMMALAMLFVSCKKEEKPEVQEAFSITASIENDGSKTYLDPNSQDPSDGYKVKWYVGDVIKVFGSTGDGVGFTCKTVESSGTEANFTSTNPVDDQGEYWAFYPASAVTSLDRNNNTFTFTMDAEQNYKDGASFADDLFPMAAHYPSGSKSGVKLQFKNAFGILKIQATGNTAVTKIVLTDNNTSNNALSGSFTFNPVTKTTTAAGSNRNVMTLNINPAVTLTSNPTYFYMILPPGCLSGAFNLKFYNGTEVVKEIDKTSAVPGFAVVRSTLKTATVDATKVHSFSVSATKKVIFASANLYYNGGTWGLYGNEWDFSTSQSSNRGLFMFSDQNSSYGLNYVNSYTEFKEWGDKLEEDGWRTLTKAEWAYLLQSGTDASNPFSDPCRPNARSLCRTKVTVHGTKGMVIMPDGWSGTIEKSYTDSEWDEMKAQGAVFLPATYGVIHNLDWANWYVLDESGTNHGWYWCSDSGNPHWGICFDSNNNQPDDWWNYHNYLFNSVMDYEIGHLGTDRGCAVRLVKDVQ